MKNLKLLFLPFLLGLLLAGCTFRVGVSLPGQMLPLPQATAQPTPAPLPQQTARANQAECEAYGSVSLLTKPTVLVSVYLNNAMDSWSSEELERSRQNLNVAVEWLNAQAEQYGQTLTLYYDDGSHEDLRRTQSWEQPFVGGSAANEGNEFYDMADLWCARLDTEALEQTYGTDRVGFLFFVPGEGCDHTMTHYADDGEDYYYEYCVLYGYDCFEPEGTFDSPAAYAHEILHLFGAFDMYEESAGLDASAELIEYVISTWPDAIMYDIYDDDNSIDYEAIHKQLCQVTAYRVGLLEQTELTALFPELDQIPPGVFRYHEYKAEGAFDTFGEGAVAARPCGPNAG